MTKKSPVYPNQKDYNSYFSNMILEILSKRNYSFSPEAKISLFIINEFKNIFTEKKLFKEASKVILKSLKNSENIYNDCLSWTSKHIIIREYILHYLRSPYSLPYVDFYTDLYEIQTVNLLKNDGFTTFTITKDNFNLVKNKIIRLGYLNNHYFSEYHIIDNDGVSKDKLIFSIIEFNKKSFKKIPVKMMCDYFYLADEDNIIKNFPFIYYEQLKNYKKNEYYLKNYLYFIKENKENYIKDDLEKTISIIQMIISNIKNDKIGLLHENEEIFTDKKTIALSKSLINYLINKYFENKVNKYFLEDVFRFFKKSYLFKNYEPGIIPCFYCFNDEVVTKKIYLIKNVFESDMVIYNQPSFFIDELMLYNEIIIDKKNKIELKMYFVLLTRLISKMSLSKDEKKAFQDIMDINDIVRNTFLADQRKEVNSNKPLQEIKLHNKKRL